MPRFTNLQTNKIEVMALIPGPSVEGEYKLKNDGSEVFFEVVSGFKQHSGGQFSVRSARQRKDSEKTVLEFEKQISLGPDKDLAGKRLIVAVMVTVKNGLKTQVELTTTGGVSVVKFGEAPFSANQKDDIVAYDFTINFPKQPRTSKPRTKKPKPV